MGGHSLQNISSDPDLQRYISLTNQIGNEIQQAISGMLDHHMLSGAQIRHGSDKLGRKSSRNSNKHTVSF